MGQARRARKRACTAYRAITGLSQAPDRPSVQEGDAKGSEIERRLHTPGRPIGQVVGDQPDVSGGMTLRQRDERQQSRPDHDPPFVQCLAPGHSWYGAT